MRLTHEKVAIFRGLFVGIALLFQSTTRAQDPVTKDLLNRQLGVWLSESTNSEGQRIKNYSWLWYVDELELSRGVHFDVDAETNKVISSLHIYGVVGESGKQSEALYFGSDGGVGTAVSMIHGNVETTRFHGVGANKRIHSGTIKREVSENGKRAFETWSDLFFDGNHVQSTPRNEDRKLDIETIMPLFQEGKIQPLGEPEILEPLKPLQPLIGRWESRRNDGSLALRIRWRTSAMGKLLVERFTFFDEEERQTGGGINVTGMHPTSGRLEMWSIGKNGFMRSGGWDVVSDNTVAQRQGNNRLIRKFTDQNTMTAYWQSKTAAGYSGENGKYTLKRVVEDE